MITKEIEYEDFHGIKQSEEFFFNLKKSELIELDNSIPGGLQNFSKRITNERDTKALMTLFKELILKAYGKPSDDGKRFIKSEELSKEFYDSAAFDELYMWLLTDVDHATEFFTALVPSMPSEQDNTRSQEIVKLPTA